MSSKFCDWLILQEISCILANRMPYIDCPMITNGNKCSRVLRNIHSLDRCLNQTTTSGSPSWLYLMETPIIIFSIFILIAPSHVIFVRPTIPSKVPHGNVPRRIARNDLIKIASQCNRSHWCLYIKTTRVRRISQIPQLYRSIFTATI